MGKDKRPTLPFTLAPSHCGAFIFRDQITNQDLEMEFKDFFNEADSQTKNLTELGVCIIKTLFEVAGVKSIKVFMQALIICCDETKGSIRDTNDKAIEALFDFFIIRDAPKY